MMLIFGFVVVVDIINKKIGMLDFIYIINILYFCLKYKIYLI